MTEEDILWREFHECRELLELVPAGFNEKSSEDDLRRYGVLCKAVVERLLKLELRRRRIPIPSPASLSELYVTSGLAHPAVCPANFDTVQSLNDSTLIDEISAFYYQKAYGTALLLKDQILNNLVINRHLTAVRNHSNS